MIQSLTARTKDVQAARQTTNEGFSFTRRVIALLCIVSVVSLPIVASMFIPDFTLTYGWMQSKGGFWFFSEGRDVMKYVTMAGMTILPFHTHTISAIIGLYFGTSSVK